MQQYFISRKNKNKFILDITEVGLGLNKITISKTNLNNFNNPIVKLVSNNLKTNKSS